AEEHGHQPSAGDAADYRNCQVPSTNQSLIGDSSMSTSDGSVLGSAQVFGAAPRNRAFNIVLLAEGFTAGQQNDFKNPSTPFVNALRATPPFDELSPAINVFRVNVS